MNTTELCRYLAEKLDVLQKIADNTERQLRFVHRREMVGLQRLLQERAKYLHHLTLLNDKLKHYPEEINHPLIRSLEQSIVAKKQEILRCNAETLQAAIAERDSIAASLQGIRQQRNLAKCYTGPWMAAGRRFNQQG